MILDSNILAIPYDIAAQDKTVAKRPNKTWVVLIKLTSVPIFKSAAKEVLNQILHIYHDATNRRYSRNGDFIHISYMLDSEEIDKVYDTKRGVFNDW